MNVFAVRLDQNELAALGHPTDNIFAVRLDQDELTKLKELAKLKASANL